MDRVADYAPELGDAPKAHMVVDGELAPTLCLGSECDPRLRFSLDDPQQAMRYLDALAREATALALFIATGEAAPGSIPCQRQRQSPAASAIPDRRDGGPRRRIGLGRRREE
jgi:hypothetical protein